MRYLIPILSLAFCSMLTHAQVYKWVDSNGKTQYSDQPQLTNAAQDKQKLKIQSAPTPVPTANADDKEVPGKSKTLADEKLGYEERRQERLKKEAQLKEKKAENKQKCIDSQSRLRVFLETPRLRMPDGKGGLVYADDNLRQQKINEANEAIKTFCQ